MDEVSFLTYTQITVLYRFPEPFIEIDNNK